MDEFEDDAFVVRQPRAGTPEATTVSRTRSAIANAVSWVYRAANDAMRTDMLTQLLRPLGMLGVVGVASGAFARLVRGDGQMPVTISTDDLVRYSGEQIQELALFAHEVNPEALQSLFEQWAQNGMGVAALGTAALVLLHRSSQERPACAGQAGSCAANAAEPLPGVAEPAASKPSQARSITPATAEETHPVW
jgi:hypothetical protein